jgi:hypothetical protein
MTSDPNPSDVTMIFGRKESPEKYHKQSRASIFVGVTCLFISFISHVLETYYQSKLAASGVQQLWNNSVQLGYRISSAVAAFTLWMAVLMLFQAVIQVRRMVTSQNSTSIEN